MGKRRKKHKFLTISRILGILIMLSFGIFLVSFSPFFNRFDLMVKILVVFAFSLIGFSEILSIGILVFITSSVIYDMFANDYSTVRGGLLLASATTMTIMLLFGRITFKQLWKISMNQMGGN